MLVVRVSSGMGNQLFQYVFAQYLKTHYKRPVYLDCSPFTYRYPERTCHLDIVSDLPEAHDWRLFNQYKSAGYRLSKMLFAVNPGTRRITEDRLVFPPDDKLLYFDGYWQTDRFANALGTLNDLLKPKAIQPSSITRWMESFQSTHAVSLHVRRGDYLSSAYRSTYDVCDANYYESAIRLVTSRLNRFTVYVFSDDLEWVKENISLPDNTYFIENEAINPYWYIYLMSTCKDNIISNSTFSWWGAYLNQHPDKMVVAPKRWTLNSEKTIALDNWITL